MDKIGPFKLYTKTPNDIHFGKLYTMEVELPILYSKKRIIRVYLPEDFDEFKKYPVLFMADGQNIVDKYTSAFGAWSIDVHEHNLIKEGYPSFIVVGIDSPKDHVHRALEYSFPFLPIENKYTGEFNKEGLEFESHLLYRYIALELLPFIRKYFPISDDRKDIGLGGSSMGGVFALSMITSYPKLFGCALIFSPGNFLYSPDKLKMYLDQSVSKLNDHRLFFYSGNVGFESNFLERTINAYNYYKSNGLKEKNLMLLTDLKAEHNEASWSKHFEEAIRFWFNKNC